MLGHFSDISASSEEDGDNIADDWLEQGGGPKERRPSSSAVNMPRNRSFTICSVITNTSDHGSIFSQRENVDRLLMSGGGEGSDSPNHHAARGLEKPFAYTYDQNYYKRGDWLRIVPRRSSADFAVRSSASGSDTISAGGSLPVMPNSGGYVHGGSPGYGNTSGNRINPDLYYRGFDNTAIRTGFLSGSAMRNPLSRIRSPLGASQSEHHQLHHHQQQATADIHNPQAAHTMMRLEEEILGVPPMGTPSTMDANISLEQGNMGMGGYIQYPTSPGHHHSHNMNPNLVPPPIDEEEGGGEIGYSEHGEISRQGSTSPPLEIHCRPDEEGAEAENLNQMYSHPDQMQPHQEVDPQLGLTVDDQHKTELHGMINQEIILHHPAPSPSPPPMEEGVRFESSLRIGDIVPPTTNNCRSSTTDSHLNQQNLPSHLQEQNMHEATWDSKYETYACRVDQSQEDRSVEIPVFSMARPHMRGFHFAWLTFFFAFLAWFAITPLLAEVQYSLGLSKQQIWTSSICSVAGAVVTRCMAGLFCDIYGARWMSVAVLIICGVPTMFTGLVNTAAGLSVLRLITGIGGSAFVTCQYWTCTMFTKEVAGTANALAAGWGNLGGAIAQIFVGSMLFPLFKWIYRLAGTEQDPAELSWRTACIIPGLMCTIFSYFVIRCSDDSPKGNYAKRKDLNLMQKPSAMKYIKAAIHDHNTWLLLIQYGCCFGVELTTSNAAALYFKEEFELSTEAAAAVASTFGWMNLFARGLGGFLSDISNAYRGMRGRLAWQLICFFLEGVFVMVFSKARTLGGAITALMTFSLFVQGAEGSTFGIVPYLNPNVTGTVAGIVGAGGNAGAVIFSILFRQMEYRAAFFWMGAATSVIAFLSSFVWIKGYEGLFFQKRVVPAPQQPENTTEAPAGGQSMQTHIRSNAETDPYSELSSNPLSR